MQDAHDNFFKASYDAMRQGLLMLDKIMSTFDAGHVPVK